MTNNDKKIDLIAYDNWFLNNEVEKEEQWDDDEEEEKGGDSKVYRRKKFLRRELKLLECSVFYQNCNVEINRQ